MRTSNFDSCYISLAQVRITSQSQLIHKSVVLLIRAQRHQKRLIAEDSEMHHTSEAELLYNLYDSLSVAIELMFTRLRHISRKLFTTGGGSRRSLSDLRVAHST